MKRIKCCYKVDLQERRDRDKEREKKERKRSRSRTPHKKDDRRERDKDKVYAVVKFVKKDRKGIPMRSCKECLYDLTVLFFPEFYFSFPG